MAQSDTRKVTFSSIVGAVAFRKGVEDFQNGAAFDAAYERTKYAWHYERGRLYAAACAGNSRAPIPNRDGQYVNRAAINDFARYYNRGDVL